MKNIKYKKEINEKEAKLQLEKGYKTAEEILKDKDKLEEFLEKLEEKLKNIPFAGDKLTMVPIMICLVRDFVSKKYTKVPIRTIIAIISALFYMLAPVDLIPDNIIGIGYIDDIKVLTECLKFISKDLDDYKKWKEENK